VATPGGRAEEASYALAQTQLARRRPRGRRLRRSLATWLFGSVAGLVFVAAFRVGYFGSLTVAWLDGLVVGTEPTPVRVPVSLVVAGDDDFRSLGEWPPPSLFPRDVLSDTIRAAVDAGAAAVCIDLLLDVPSAQDDALESSLRTVAERGTPVFLVCSAWSAEPSRPLERFAQVARVACADVLAGPQGEARAVPPTVTTPWGRKPSLAFAVAESLAAQAGHGGRLPDRSVPIDCAQVERSVGRYPLLAVNRHAIPRNWLAGSIVVIGRTDSLGGDVLLIADPRGLAEGGTLVRSVPGVDVQAAALCALLASRRRAQAGPLVDAALVLCAAGILTWLLTRLGNVVGTAVGFGVILVGGGAVSLGLFGTTGHILGLAPVLLGSATHAMAIGWLDRWRLSRTLGQLVSPDLAARIERSLEVVPGEGQVSPVAALTFDIRGSTELASRARPEHVGSLLADLLGVVAAEVVDAGGMVSKFLGDGLLALFVSEGKHHDAGQRALRAVEGIDRAVAGGPAAAWSEATGARLDYVVSATYGSAWIGFVGFHRRAEFTALGQTINLAFELQEAAKRDGFRILVSADLAGEVGAETVARYAAVTVERPRGEGTWPCLTLSCTDWSEEPHGAP